MPHSTNFGNRNIFKFISDNFDKNATILDVGAGAGKYGDLLKKEGFNNVDAIEIFQPYIEAYRLKDKYKTVYNDNIISFKFNFYNIIFMSDVIEHLSIKDAKITIEKFIKENKTDCIIVKIPFNSKQGEDERGNKYEIHLQQDLTPSIMKTRYPYLDLLTRNAKRFAVYSYLRRRK